MALFNDFKDKGVISLKDYAPIVKGEVKRYVVEENDKMRVALMAFDTECLLAEHKAPGNGLFTVLEGRAAINYKGTVYNLKKGESFAFPKGELHSVYAPEQLVAMLVIDMA